MRTISLFLLQVGIVLTAQTAFGSTPLERLFSDTYVTGYRPNRCGSNIMNLVELAQSRGIDMRRAKLVEIFNLVDKNYDYAKVQAEYVRTSSGEPGSTFWNFHVVLELDGSVYDFDFANEPTVLSVRDYAEKMWLSSKAIPFPKWFTGCKESLLIQCTGVKIYPALDYIATGGKTKPEQMTIGEWAYSFTH